MQSNSTEIFFIEDTRIHSSLPEAESLTRATTTIMYQI